jgi:hypothetical protein
MESGSKMGNLTGFSFIHLWLGGYGERRSIFRSDSERVEMEIWRNWACDGMKTKERKAQSREKEMRRTLENWGTWAGREDRKFNGKKFQRWGTECGSLAGFFCRIVIWVYCCWWAKRKWTLSGNWLQNSSCISLVWSLEWWVSKVLYPLL